MSFTMLRFFRNNYSKKNASLSQENGIVMVFVAISIVSLIGIIGLAVDGANLYRAKLLTQKAADAAVFAVLGQLTADQGNTTGNSAPSGNEPKLESALEAHFLQNIALAPRIGVELSDYVISTKEVDVDAERVQLIVDFTVDTFLLGVLGISDTALKVASTAAKSPSVIVFVVDASGSMLCSSPADPPNPGEPTPPAPPINSACLCDEFILNQEGQPELERANCISPGFLDDYVAGNETFDNGAPIGIPKINKVIDQLENFVERFNPTKDRVGVIAYNSSATVFHSVCPDPNNECKFDNNYTFDKPTLIYQIKQIAIDVGLNVTDIDAISDNPNNPENVAKFLNLSQSPSNAVSGLMEAFWDVEKLYKHVPAFERVDSNPYFNRNISFVFLSDGAPTAARLFLTDNTALATGLQATQAKNKFPTGNLEDNPLVDPVADPSITYLRDYTLWATSWQETTFDPSAPPSHQHVFYKVDGPSPLMKSGMVPFAYGSPQPPGWRPLTDNERDCVGLPPNGNACKVRQESILQMRSFPNYYNNQGILLPNLVTDRYPNVKSNPDCSWLATRAQPHFGHRTSYIKALSLDGCVKHLGFNLPGGGNRIFGEDIVPTPWTNASVEGPPFVNSGTITFSNLADLCGGITGTDSNNDGILDTPSCAETEAGVVTPSNDPNRYHYRQQFYHAAIAMSDILRESGGTVYSIGFGEQATYDFSDPYQNVSSDNERKDFFLLRVANDPRGKTGVSDPAALPGSPLQPIPSFAFSDSGGPGGSVADFNDLDDTFGAGKKGIFFDSEVDQLNNVFDVIARRIKLRLTR